MLTSTPPSFSNLQQGTKWDSPRTTGQQADEGRCVTNSVCPARHQLLWVKPKI